MFWNEKHSEKLDDPGHTVKIDEAKFGKVIKCA